jgi:hypothetical protein
MIKKYFNILILFFIFYGTTYCQDTAIANKGAYVQIISSYVNTSCDIMSGQLANRGLQLFANIKGGLGVGTSLGYRFHGKASVDVSIDINYIYSSHRIQYEYPSSIIEPTIDSTLLNHTEINRLDLHTLSIDLGVYYFTQSRLQPYIKFGFAFLLKNIHLEATPFDYYVGYDRVRESYGFEKTYSCFSPHCGMGLSYFLTKNIALNGTIYVDWYFFNIRDIPVYFDDKFSVLNIGYRSSIMIFF